jgi:hypothetical protein
MDRNGDLEARPALATKGENTEQKERGLLVIWRVKKYKKLRIGSKSKCTKSKSSQKLKNIVQVSSYWYYRRATNTESP